MWQVDDPSKYGVVVTSEECMVERFVEKPKVGFRVFHWKDISAVTLERQTIGSMLLSRKGVSIAALCHCADFKLLKKARYDLFHRMFATSGLDYHKSEFTCAAALSDKLRAAIIRSGQ